MMVAHSDMIKEKQYETLWVSALLLVLYSCVLFLLKRRRAVCTSQVRLDGKTAIVTGGTGGIGYETAMDLARRGCRVIITGRNHLKGLKCIDEISHETGNYEIAYRPLDLTSMTSVKHFAAIIYALEPRLDILVNNAGILGTTDHAMTEDDLERTFQVNYFAPFLLTNLLLDLLEKTNSSRIVNVSSIAHKWSTLNLDNLNSEICYYPHKVYFDSKLALVCFSNELSSHISKKGVTSNSLHPGTVNTMLFSTMPFYLRIAIDILGWFFWKTPAEGAQTSIYVAVSKDLNNVSGSYYSECHINQENRQCLDKVFRKKLWAVTERIVDLEMSNIEMRSLTRSLNATCTDTNLFIDELGDRLPENIISEIVIGLQLRMMKKHTPVADLSFDSLEKKTN